MSDILERATKALEGVAPGPWEVVQVSEIGQTVWVRNKRGLIAKGALPTKFTGQEGRYLEEVSEYLANSDFIAYARTGVPELLQEVKRLREALRNVIEAAERAQGSHHAPDDCYATGPLTGNPIADFVACPGCTQQNEIAEARKLLKVTP